MNGQKRGAALCCESRKPSKPKLSFGVPLCNTTFLPSFLTIDIEARAQNLLKNSLEQRVRDNGGSRGTDLHWRPLCHLYPIKRPVIFDEHEISTTAKYVVIVTFDTEIARRQVRQFTIESRWSMRIRAQSCEHSLLYKPTSNVSRRHTEWWVEDAGRSCSCCKYLVRLFSSSARLTHLPPTRPSASDISVNSQKSQAPSM